MYKTKSIDLSISIIISVKNVKRYSWPAVYLAKASSIAILSTNLLLLA